MSSPSTRGLYLPPELLALMGQVNTDALLVLAEILELHKIKGSCFASDDHFIERFGYDPRTLKRYIKELKDANLISADTKQNRLPKRIITPLVRVNYEPQPSAKNDTSSGQKRHQPSAKNGPNLVSEMAPINSSSGNSSNTQPLLQQGGGGESSTSEELQEYQQWLAAHAPRIWQTIQPDYRLTAAQLTSFYANYGQARIREVLLEINGYHKLDTYRYQPFAEKLQTWCQNREEGWGMKPAKKASAASGSISAKLARQRSRDIL